ncbi:MAG: starch-binding protein [Clostridia bacterium]|nr:starch-binding protein [Clostridia bacterium]
MKNTIKILSLLLVLVLSLSIFAGCGIVDDPNNAVEGGKTFVTITWMQGQRLIKEEVVEKGTLLTEWTPEGSGEFKGWYERPYIKKFDFSKPVTKSMIIYASFIGGDDGGTGETETPDWYLIGAGKGDLGKCNNWNHEAAAANLGLVAGEDGIYRVTLSLYAGDQFKMTNNFGWDNEKAIDKMAGFANGSVKDADGNVVFTAGENNNFVVAEGMDGKYEITYDANADVMGFTFLEALESMPDDIRLIGDNNGWGTSYGEDDYKFTSNDNENWTYTWDVTSVPATFKVYNNLSGVYYPGGVGNDLHIDVAGVYTIEFNIKTRNIVVKDADGNTVDVGFTGDNGGGDNGGGSTITPNANPVEKVYIVLNDEWNDGSLVGAWTWPGDIWATATATDVEGVLELVIPAGTNMLLFVDFNEGTADPSWDAMRVQTGDYATPDKSDDKIYYHVSNGTWSNNAETPGESGGNEGGNEGGNGPALTETVTVYFENNWLWTNVSCHYWGGEGVVGTEWPGQAMTVVGTLNGHDVYSIELPVGVTGFLFTGNKDTDPNAIDQSPDIATTGIANGSAWRMDWADGNIVTGFTYDPNGDNTDTPVVPDPVVPTEGTKLYLVPGVWADGSLMGAWVWSTGSASTWVSVIDSDADGIYEVVVPTGCDNIIFVDFKAGATSMDWSNKANQTSDLIVPTDDNIYYHVNACVWKNNAEPEEDAADVYTVAGAAGLCGVEWSTGATQNDMTYDEATGVYTKVFTGIAAGTYEYKVVLNHNWGTGEFPASGNYSVTVTDAGSTVTVTWNPATSTLEATVS